MRQSEILAYTAGIIDGEGCISITKRKRPQAELAIKFQSAKKTPSRWTKTEADWAVEEAQRITMNGYNKRGIHPD